MPDPEVLSIIARVDPAGTGPDGPLFDAPTLQALAAVGSAEAKLLAIAYDAGVTPAGRFVAAKALLEGGWTEWRSVPANRRVVADALAEALAHDRAHNRWGLPGVFVGPFGEQLMSLGAEARAALRPLLDDRRPLVIEGSEAATLNAQAHYRVVDLAAWLLAADSQQQWRRAP